MPKVTDDDMNNLLMGRATQEQKNHIRMELQDEDSFASRWIKSFRSAASNPFDISMTQLIGTDDANASQMRTASFLEMLVAISSSWLLMIFFLPFEFCMEMLASLMWLCGKRDSEYRILQELTNAYFHSGVVGWIRGSAKAHQTTRMLIAKGRLEDAERQSLRALGMSEQYSAYLSQALFLSILGEISMRRGAPADAMKWLQEADTIYSKFGIEHRKSSAFDRVDSKSYKHAPEYAKALNNIAVCHAKLGHIDDAALYFERAIRFMETSVFKNPILYAVTVSNYATVMKTSGGTIPDDVEECVQHLRNIFPASHPVCDSMKPKLHFITLGKQENPVFVMTLFTAA